MYIPASAEKAKNNIYIFLRRRSKTVAMKANKGMIKTEWNLGYCPNIPTKALIC